MSTYCDIGEHLGVVFNTLSLPQPWIFRENDGKHFVGVVFDILSRPQTLLFREIDVKHFVGVVFDTLRRPQQFSEFFVKWMENTSSASFLIRSTIL